LATRKLILRSLKPAWAADSMRPTLLNPMSLSSLRLLSIMKSGLEIHWLKLQAKKQKLSNRAFRLFPLHSEQKPKQSFEREPPSATRRCDSYTKFTTGHQLLCVANTKNRMPQ